MTDLNVSDAAFLKGVDRVLGGYSLCSHSRVDIVLGVYMYNTLSLRVLLLCVELF